MLRHTKRRLRSRRIKGRGWGRKKRDCRSCSSLTPPPRLTPSPFIRNAKSEIAKWFRNVVAVIRMWSAIHEKEVRKFCWTWNKKKDTMWHWPIGKDLDLSFIRVYHHLHIVSLWISLDQLNTSQLATPCWRDPTRSKQLSTVVIWLSVWTLSCRCPVKLST